MAEKTHFIRQVIDYLYPAQNRVIAAVAFVRTFKQTFTGAFTVGGAGLITVSASDVATITWDVVLYTAAALLLSALLSGGVAFDDVSRNGLNSKYMDAANPAKPAVVVEAAAVGNIVKGLSESRPFWMVPAGTVASPEAAPVAATEPEKVEATKPKTTGRRAAKKVADEVNLEKSPTYKVDQAPAVEEPA